MKASSASMACAQERRLGGAILTACVDAARTEGFTQLALMATLPGVPLYKAFGFTEVETVELTMPDGVVLGGVAMKRPVDLPDKETYS